MQNAVAFGASRVSGVLLSNGSCRNPNLQNASVWRLAFKETCLVSKPSFWGNSSPTVRKGSRFRFSIIGSSSLEDSRACPQPGLKTTKVKFILQKECSFGQSFSVVGDTPELGAWEACSAVPMTWSDGHIWSVELELPQGKRFDYKFLLIRDPHTVEWQPGPNRVFITHNNLYSLTVSQSWDFDEYANLKTQVIPEEEDRLDSSNGNVAIGEEELCSTQSLEGQSRLDESAHYADMENMEDTKVLALEVQCNISNHEIQEQLNLGIQQEDAITSSTTREDETLDQEESSSAPKVKYIEEETGSKNIEDISSPQSLLQKDIAWSVKALSNLLGSFGLLKFDEKSSRHG